MPEEKLYCVVSNFRCYVDKHDIIVTFCFWTTFVFASPQLLSRNVAIAQWHKMANRPLWELKLLRRLCLSFLSLCICGSGIL